ncbi:MAG TPA: SMP-30/gluconolactonase/LRE family protein, partial [Cytophagales bacterium]|nr:SMP-30/gluconolactonase/LRE family protein [Cytophagales bacterium]
SGNTIYHWDPNTQQVSVFFSPSGGANGLVLDHEGNLLAAQQNKRTVARISNGVETTIAERYEGKRLNSPNDIVIKSDGNMFFTDPPYGVTKAQEELGFYGIYRLSPNGTLTLLDKTLKKPNGIVFSPDESKLYVSDTEERRVYVWDVLEDATLANRKEFAYMSPRGNADGMTVDEEGNLYCTGPIGIWIYAADGTILDTIPIPGQVTNCAFGGEDGKTLFVTAGSSLYKVSNAKVTTIQDRELDEFIPLEVNYPNPVTQQVNIPVYLKEKQKVKLEIRDTKGETLALVAEQDLSEGRHHFVWNTQATAAGTYFVCLSYGEKMYSRAFVIE